MVICQPWNLIPERCNQHSQNCARYWTAIYAVSFGSKTFFFAAFVQVVGHPERVSNWRKAARSRHGTGHNSDSVAGWRRVICIAFLPWDEVDFEHYTMMWRSERPTTAIHKPNLDVVLRRRTMGDSKRFLVAVVVLFPGSISFLLFPMFFFVLSLSSSSFI